MYVSGIKKMKEKFLLKQSNKLKKKLRKFLLGRREHLMTYGNI